LKTLLTKIKDRTMIKRKIEIEVDPNPAELAQAFCCMCSDDQAAFLNEVARQTENWPGPFCFQLQAITDEEGLTPEARSIMRGFGEYADKSS
jgi:hypothetical protein